MPSSRLLPLALLCGLSLFSLSLAADPIQVSIDPKPATNYVVESNFLGISFELSFMDEYFGNDTSTIPKTMMTYLSALRSRTGSNPLLLRVGGNSMDSSTYVPTQGSPMLQLQSGPANSNNQPVNYGPVLWDVMNKVSNDLNGTKYLVGLSLLDPNSSNIPLLAGGAQKSLGDHLDAFLLGNEPDLYTSHGNRPGLKNYTVQNYLDEFRNVSDHLTNTVGGNILDQHDIAGPTICCNWNLDELLNEGYITKFNNFLKYITLQHYPQNNCFGSYAYELPWYLQHANVVTLGAWQRSGIALARSASKPVVMSEFNSASCGGIPKISDTFGVGTLWTVDYTLQLASVGYTTAYLHTRERGISYNLFAPPAGPNGGPGAWTTNPPYYALLATTEILKSANGGIVVDLNLAQSKTDLNAKVAGYAVYDSGNFTVQQIALFNYANTTSATSTFTLPSSVFATNAKSSVIVKYLTSPSMNESTNIAWGGQTLAGVSDGQLVSSSSSWVKANDKLNCSNGCTVTVPGTTLAVVFASGQSDTKPALQASDAGKNAAVPARLHGIGASMTILVALLAIFVVANVQLLS
ncbi:glycoside hydrolase family 79 protein [Crucibulum laeve]|uniref:Glycoside hydrolase family 79 protein n=1 Tax=Crucibulum laeve TaxID=68775 RepID=A0A5C3MGC8_9AGAR|nr:glycoside hydrolase family 79 protein [Crucibulum laeve]